MGLRTLIGTTTTAGGGFTARWLHCGDHPDRLLPVLRQIWRHTFDQDTKAMTGALLARDWSHLDPATRHDDRRLLIHGIGSAASPGLPPRIGSLTAAVDLGLEWLYLIGADATVTVYEATIHDRWLRHSHHQLPDADERFTPHPTTRCTTCGAIDEIEHHQVPSMAGYSRDDTIACIRCGTTETSGPQS